MKCQVSNEDLLQAKQAYSLLYYLSGPWNALKERDLGLIPTELEATSEHCQTWPQNKQNKGLSPITHPMPRMVCFVCHSLLPNSLTQWPFHKSPINESILCTLIHYRYNTSPVTCPCSSDFSESGAWESH